MPPGIVPVDDPDAYHSYYSWHERDVPPAIILNRLLHITAKKSTWIFVADTSFRLYGFLTRAFRSIIDSSVDMSE
jgi:hypothetical protein